MHLLKTMRALVAAIFVSLALAGSQVLAAPAATAAPAPLLATALTYNASGAGEYSSTADQAAQIWNSYVPNVSLRRGTGGTITIYVTNSGGSRAYVQGLGRGTVYIDRTQVRQGHSPLRILTHELGHILGLPDNYNGSCAILMSGGSAGTSCSNPYPSSAEASRVNQLFSRGLAAQKARDGLVLQPSRVY